jgi:hypothetical protein
MTSDRTVHRNYVIKLEHDADAQRWHVVAITHRLTDRDLLLPASGYYLSRADAEGYAKAAINVQLSRRYLKLLRRRHRNY